MTVMTAEAGEINNRYNTLAKCRELAGHLCLEHGDAEIVTRTQAFRDEMADIETILEVTAKAVEDQVIMEEVI